MPPLQLTSLLQTALPNLSDSGRAVMSALGCVNGRPPCSAELASWLGFHDRYQLARTLRREGLPPLEVLGGWARTLYWLIETEASGVSLRELADREQLDPAVAYRLVRRITGRRWSEVRREGLTVALLRFRESCRHVMVPARRPLALAVGDTHHRPLSVAGFPFPMKVVPAASPRVRGHLRGVLGDRVPVPGAPFDVALTATDIALVTRPHASSLSVLELDPPRVAQSIPVGATPSRVVPSLSGAFAYVTCQFVETIDVVDLSLRRHTVSIPVRGHPLGASLSPDGQTLYVATNCDRLLAVSLARQAVTGDIPIPHGSLQLRMHPSGRRLFVSCWRSGTIVEIELPTLRHRRTFEVGGAVQELVFTADGQTMYAANEGGWLDVIHIPTGHRTATLRFGTFAMGLALSADEADIIVGLLYAGRVLVIDRKSLTVRAMLETGGKPRLIATHSKGNVLVANEAGWVDFIH